MTPEEFQRHLNSIADGLPDQIRGAVDATGREAVGVAQHWSSGTMTRSQQRQLRYPYARSRGYPLLDPDRVNIQSGQFFAGWAQQRTQAQGDDVIGGAVNNSRVSELYLWPGTRLMFARRPNEAAAEQVGPFFRAQVEDALDELLR